MYKSSKLSNRIKIFFVPELRNKLTQKKYLKQILKKLNHRKHNILEAISETNSVEKKKNLQRDLDIIHAQRKKGLKMMKKMKHYLL